MLILLTIFSGLISFFALGCLIKKSSKLGLIDIPNARSSHNKPTPKGGGLGMVLGVFAAIAAGFLINLIDSRIEYLLLISSFLAMAVLGFYSDRFNIPAFIRLILQVVIAAIIVYSMKNSLSSFEILGYRVTIGHLGVFLGIVWLVGITNFYNFMDGIDGLAAMQGIISGIAIAVFGIILGRQEVTFLGLILFGAVSGYLFFNITRAKIFMGDVGSYFLGFYIASIGLIDNRLLVPVALLLGVFIFDTVVTLITRIIRKEIWYEAHRSHFYQRAVSLEYSHVRVTFAISLITVLLAVIACAYLLEQSSSIRILLIAVTITVLVISALFVIYKEKNSQRVLAERG